MASKAAVIMVTSLADSGQGTLREALINANASGDADIDLAHLSGMILLRSALPEVTAHVRLLGPSEQNLVISGAHQWPVLAFAAGSTSEVSHLTFTEALAAHDRNGAAISNAGTLVLSSCVISSNRNEGGWGAGIFNQGNLSLLNCFLSANVVSGEKGADGNLLTPEEIGNRGPGGGGAGLGGALFHEAGTLRVSHCVFHANAALGGSGGASGASTDPLAGRGGGAMGGTAGTETEAGQDGGFGGGGGGGGGGVDVPGTLPRSPGNGGFGGGAGGSAWSFTMVSGGFGGGAAAPLCNSGGGGGGGMGAAIFARNGHVLLLDSLFQSNRVVGGDGGVGVSHGGDGGSGVGAAIFNLGAELEMTRCSILQNEARGGDGAAPDQPVGGFCAFSPGGGGAAEGAGLLLYGGVFRLFDSLISSNLSAGGRGGGGPLGGPGGHAQGAAVAIHNGDASIQRSTFAFNQLLGGAPGSATRIQAPAGSASGGAIWIGSGRMEAENCTFSANHVRGADATQTGMSRGLPGASLGGSIAVVGSPNTPDATLRFCTVASNIVEQSVLTPLFPSSPEPAGQTVGGGLYQTNAVLRLSGVICAGNQSVSDPDIHGGIESVSRNLVSNPGTAAGLQAHDLTGMDPLLGALDDFGGFAPTHALLPESPAIDAVEVAPVPETDQRGVNRPQGARADLGAFELSMEPMGPMLIEPQRTASGSVRFSISGIPQQAYSVGLSTNLHDWVEVGTIRAGEFFEHADQRPVRFYRAEVRD
jgi:hypothetical protein